MTLISEELFHLQNLSSKRACCQYKISRCVHGGISLFVTNAAAAAAPTRSHPEIQADPMDRGTFYSEVRNGSAIVDHQD